MPPFEQPAAIDAAALVEALPNPARRRLCYPFPAMKTRFFLLLGACVLLSAGLPACAQMYVAKAIEFKGAAEYSQQELLDAAGLKPGISLTQAGMQDHGQKLMDTGLFDNLTFRFDGNTLTYMLTPAAGLLPVRLENLPLAGGSALDAALRKRFGLYHGKVPQDGSLTQAVRKALEEMLAAKGLQASVLATPYVDPNLRDVTAVSYAVQSPPVRVGAIDVQGASAEMLDKVKRTAKSLEKSAYDTENSTANVARAFALLYSDEGYAAARLRVEQAANPVAGSQAIEVPFTVSVEEGRHYKLGTIRLPSGEALDLARIDQAAGLTSTTTEKFTVKEGVTLRAALQFVTGQYKQTGHMDCVVTPHAELDEAAGVANYRIEVDPGPVYTMGKLTIENGADDLRAAMLAAWKLPEGAVFNINALSDYFRKQGNTPLGRTFDSSICRYKLAAHRDTHTVDVTLRLERKP